MYYFTILQYNYGLSQLIFVVLVIILFSSYYLGVFCFFFNLSDLSYSLLTSFD